MSSLPDGANWLTPYLTVASVEESFAFYAQAFGFEEEMSMPGKDGKAVHGSMLYQGKSVVMMGPRGAWGSTAKTPANAGIEPAAVLQFQRGIEAKKIWGADRVPCSCHFLAFVMQIGKGEAVCLREELHLVERVIRIIDYVVRADCSNADTDVL